MFLISNNLNLVKHIIVFKKGNTLKAFKIDKPFITLIFIDIFF